MKLHIIYTEDKMILSKKNYLYWREIQEEYEDYKASLGPWGIDEVVEYLADEYSNLEPEARTQVAKLVSSSDETLLLEFID